MRIQHNIMAMNAYRNYSNNTSALSKNLEKLSSGYKINRAGDDAAGLAISEKMRAQITGLDVAQKNAKDGISLVQTAEGALTEVHDMLNRMVELANQSANGTYDSTDRQQLQKEIDELTSEIDRIADSSNFNGIKLLDGSLAGSGSVGSSGNVAVDFSGKSSWITQGTSQAQVSTATFAAIANGDLAAGDTISMELKMSDGSTYKLSATMVKGTTGTNDNKLVLADGTTLASNIATTVGLTNAEMADFVVAALNRDASFTSKYKVTDGINGGLTITANNNSFDTASITSLNISGGKASVSASSAITTEGKGNYNILNVGNMTIYDASSDTKNKENSIVTINGQQFAFVKDAASAKELGSNVNVITVATGTNPTATDVSKFVDLVNQKTGLNIKAPTAGTSIDMISYGNGGASSGGLTLQIGDTSDSFNQLNVSIGNTHAASLGIDGINISTQGGAQAAVEVIKNAINTVSDIRGTLGATQNRLDHTINNLSVMQENIQDAESTIRDTDVADEMMEYTKNNILIQSAQAMLAQANQVPQGVLQLLQ